MLIFFHFPGLKLITFCIEKKIFLNIIRVGVGGCGVQFALTSWFIFFYHRTVLSQPGAGETRQRQTPAEACHQQTATDPVKSVTVRHPLSVPRIPPTRQNKTHSLNIVHFRVFIVRFCKKKRKVLCFCVSDCLQIFGKVIFILSVSCAVFASSFAFYHIFNISEIIGLHKIYFVVKNDKELHLQKYFMD